MADFCGRRRDSEYYTPGLKPTLQHKWKQKYQSTSKIKTQKNRQHVNEYVQSFNICQLVTGNLEQQLCWGPTARAACQHKIDSIAVSVFEVILVEFDKSEANPKNNYLEAPQHGLPVNTTGARKEVTQVVTS